jgi:hypothetical protein
LVVGFLVQSLLLFLPLTFDFSAWYSTGAMLSLLMTAGLAAYGFFVSLGGQALLRDETA